MIDQNRDGFIDKEDLHDMLASLGNKKATTRSMSWYSTVVNSVNWGTRKAPSQIPPQVGRFC